jgi:DNA-binding transcriptional ArsR family regulator
MAVVDRLSVVYGALSDSTRRGMLQQLRHGELTVAELRRPFTISAPAVSKHLAVLESAGLIQRHKVGRHQLCLLRPDPLDDARRWLEEQRAFWTGTLDSLEGHLNRGSR